MNTREKAFQALAKTGSCNAELILRTLEAAGFCLVKVEETMPVELARKEAQDAAEDAWLDETDGPGWDEQDNDTPTYRHDDLREFFVRGWLKALDLTPQEQ